MQFPELADRLAEVRERIDAAIARGGRSRSVTIVAVTKSHGPEAVQAAWDCGLRAVGENRVQEALGKIDLIGLPIAWHLIGHLQRNKVKHLNRFALFHALDSTRLAQAVHEVGRASAVPVPVLIQVNSSGEASKGGFTLAELRAEAAGLLQLGGFQVRGVMTMAPLEADDETLRATFRGARDALQMLQDAGHHASELSMGMSNDYEVAVEEGATIVRLGTILFGERTS
jgi:pyridoxal phosphate enzyme (YggS family)